MLGYLAYFKYKESRQQKIREMGGRGGKICMGRKLGRVKMRQNSDGRGERVEVTVWFGDCAHHLGEIDAAESGLLHSKTQKMMISHHTKLESNANTSAVGQRR